MTGCTWQSWTARQTGREGEERTGKEKRGTRAGLNDSTLGAAHWPPRSPVVPACAGLQLHVQPRVVPQPVPRYLPRQAWWPGTRTHAAPAPPRAINSTMYGRDARMASVGRLIPVSGGFQKSAGRVSRGRPSGSPQHLSTLSTSQHHAVCLPGPIRVQDGAACQRDATRNPVVDGDQSRSELVTPSRCVVMALNPYGWNRDRSWSVSPPGISMPPCHRARHACSPAGTHVLPAPSRA